MLKQENMTVMEIVELIHYKLLKMRKDDEWKLLVVWAVFLGL